MRVIFATLLEVTASAVVLIPLYVLLNRLWFRSVRKSIFYCVFSLYLAAVYTLVGMPNITYVRFELNLNFVPIIGFIEAWKSSLLNILLFVPLGIMLPIGWHKYKSKKDTVLFGLGMSLVIEILQIFTFRASDVNDLITNTFGTFLGFVIANAMMKKTAIIRKLVDEKKTSELSMVCSIAMAVMFFIHPFISSAMWDMIY